MSETISSDRNATIAEIRLALKRRSGKPWSVTGGRGTAWGWIHITAPPARRMAKHREKAGVNGYCANWSDQYEEYDSGEPGNSMFKREAEELARLFNIEVNQCSDGIGIPASSDYRQEYIERANGKTPTKVGQPYWD